MPTTRSTRQTARKTVPAKATAGKPKTQGTAKKSTTARTRAGKVTDQVVAAAPLDFPVREVNGVRVVSAETQPVPYKRVKLTLENGMVVLGCGDQPCRFVGLTNDDVVAHRSIDHGASGKRAMAVRGLPSKLLSMTLGEVAQLVATADALEAVTADRDRYKTQLTALQQRLENAGLQLVDA